jgi:stage III sporulation protein AG
MGSFQRFLEKYHMDKWFQKENLLVLILTGILLVVIALPIKENEEVSEFGVEQIIQTGTTSGNVPEEDQKQEESGTDAYITSLEEKLTDILSKIKGAGKVYVMITLQESEELIMENDYVIKTAYPKVEGVVVVAQGAGTGKVTQHITEAVQALFGIELHKIKVTGS